MIHVRKKVPTERNFKISLFPDFFQRLKFSLTRSEIPWLFRDLEEILFSLTISWPVATMTPWQLTLGAHWRFTILFSSQIDREYWDVFIGQ